MNREQQRQNARDQKRIEQRQKARQKAVRPAPPALKKRPGSAAAPARTYATVPERRSRLPEWWPWAAAAATLAIIVALFLLLDPLGLFTPLPGKKVASQGNEHVQPGGTHVAYSTNPPSSGPHFDTVPRRGIYTTPFITEYLPHFLEHGGVDVTYNSSASQDVINKLTSIVNAELDKGAGQVLLAPRPDMACQVAVTAWQRIETFGTPGCQTGSVGHDFNPKASKDVDLITSFVERNQCQYDPENACGGGAHGSRSFPAPAPGEATVTASLGTATPAAGASGATPIPGPLAPNASPTP